MQILLFRLIAFLIDVIFVFVSLIIIFKVYALFFGLTDYSLSDIRNSNYYLKYSLFLIFFSYPIICSFILSNKTIGMKILSLELADTYGLDIKKTTFISRQIILYIIFIFGLVFMQILVAFLLTLLVKKEGHIVDWMFSTTLRFAAK